MSRCGSTFSRRLIALLCAVSLGVQIGCYSYLPIQETTPVAGTEVGVILNDQGRQLVKDKLGELVDRVDGTLVSASETAITLSVNRTQSLRGSESAWAGESVEIPREGILGFRERQRSRARTVFLTIGLIVGVAALISAMSLAVGGNGTPNEGGPCPPNCPEK